MTKISRRHALSMIAAAGTAALLPSLSLASDKTIICAWNNQFPPYSWENNGKMTGILVDCMDELLGKRMGYTLRHEGDLWPTAQDLVRAGKADALCTNDTDARKQFMHFTEEPFVESLPSIFCAVDNPRIQAINGIEDLDGLKDFRQVDYRGNAWARKTFPPYLRITYVDSLFDVFKMLSRGEADIFVGNGLAAMYAIKTLGLKNKIHARELPVGEPSSFHFGLRRDFPDAQKIIDEFEVTMDESLNVTREIVLRYL